MDKQPQDHQDSISVRGRRYSIIRALRLGGKKYLLLERLSGLREIYLAWDSVAGPKGDLRAIHILPKSKAANQKIQALQRISNLNQNLPQILEFFRFNGLIHLVTTWTHGEPLDHYLNRCRSSDARWPSAFLAFRLFRGLAHGLCQLHHHGQVIHGDLKPANIVLQEDIRRLVMIDYGSAWCVERTNQRLSGDGISRKYSAPEVVRDEASFDARADQFSASVIAYELLTGQLPFDGLAGEATVEDTVENELTLIPPSQLSQDRNRIPLGLWRGIDGVVCRGLALDRAERFEDRRTWLGAIDAAYAELQNPRELSRWNRAAASVLNWIVDRTH